jgi:hypothetical protein
VEALPAELAKFTDWLPILLEVINEPPEAGLEAVAELPEQEAAVVAVDAFPPILSEPAVPVKPEPEPENDVAVTELVNVPVVPLTVLAVEEPIAVPLILPPVMATLLAFWVDIVPKPPATFCTKAVVAIWSVLVPAAAVGAVGIPVNDGFTAEIAPANTAEEPVNAPVKLVVPVTTRLPLMV